MVDLTGEMAGPERERSIKAEMKSSWDAFADRLFNAFDEIARDYSVSDESMVSFVSSGYGEDVADQYREWVDSA